MKILGSIKKLFENDLRNLLLAQFIAVGFSQRINGKQISGFSQKELSLFRLKPYSAFNL